MTVSYGLMRRLNSPFLPLLEGFTLQVTLAEPGCLKEEMTMVEDAPGKVDAL